MSPSQYLHDQNKNRQADIQSLAMSLMAVSNNVPRFPTNDWRMFGGGGVGGVDLFGQEFAPERCNSLSIGRSDITSVPYTPIYDKADILNTYDMPYPDQSPLEFPNTFETKQKLPMTHDSNQSAVELDKKLLGFSNPIGKAALFDDTGQTWPIMAAELYGMFFVAEDVFGEQTTRANELTCYRRNLFQINGTIILSRGTKGIMNEQGQVVPFYNLEATISAFESIEGKATNLISVPWKSATCLPNEEKTGSRPPRFPLDLTANPESDPTMISVPLSWKRLQFKHATANNGRRKGLQQHYVVQVNLVATLATGECRILAEIQSGPIIVRGRSPRNFDSRIREGEKKVEVIMTSTNESGNSLQVKLDPGAGCDKQLFATDPSQGSSPDQQDWPRNNIIDKSDLHQMKKSKTSYLPGSNFQSSTHQNIWKPESFSNKTALQSPIELSLTEDDYSVGNSTSTIGSETSNVPRSPETEKSNKSICSNNLIESTDFLYEYFPLSVDDWMPPVDAVYRPHIVHHMIIPEDQKAQHIQGKRKKYFSASD